MKILGFDTSKLPSPSAQGAIPILVLLVLIMMLVPLPAIILDILFTFNIALSIIVLFTAINIKSFKDFVAFPTVLLLTTLLRLSLNVASTRIVLLDGYKGTDAAGKVIEAFGVFLIGGNFAVGIVIFIVITIINFVVITKGSGRVAEVLANLKQAEELGTKMASAKSVLFLGRNVGFPVAMEGALKLKELAYIHAEGFAAGELKHGPIALIEEGQPVIVIVPSPRDDESLHPKVISNIQEIRARGAKVIAIAEEGDQQVGDYAEHVIFVPQSESILAPILTVIPLQAFALALSTAKGLDVDQPRNLAKSVTVE